MMRSYCVLKQLRYQFLRFKTMLKNPSYFNSSLWDSLSGEYYRSFKNKEDYSLPSYGLLDIGIASLGIKVFGEQETRFTLKCSNLLDQRYVEPGFLGIDVPGLGRRIAVRMEQNF